MSEIDDDPADPGPSPSGRGSCVKRSIAYGVYIPIRWEFSLPRKGAEFTIRNETVLVEATIRSEAELRRAIANLLKEGAAMPAAPPPAPPFQWGQYILTFLLPLSRQDEVLGDLEETFHKQVTRFGEKRASFWFYSAVLGLIFSQAVRRVWAALPVAAVIEFLRFR